MKLAVIAGPTASGKTALGVLLAKYYGGEVVSADSMQIYRGMDIGTAKPTIEEMDGVPHHMIDVADPAESWSVARYVEAASAVVDDILRRGKLPIIVGGTGLYIDSLLAGRGFAGEDRDDGVREELCAEYDRIGGEAFREKLRAVDPERAEKLAANDKRRLVRAMEVYVLTGETITAHDEKTRALPPRYTAARIHLDCVRREDLYERIDRRVDLMAEAGLVEEVRALLESGVPESATSMQAIGYKEIVRALRGEITLEEGLDLIRRESRRYAKRQLTWFKRSEDAAWLRWDEKPDFDMALHFSTKFLAGHGIE